MRKGIAEGKTGTTEFNVKALYNLQDKGYKFFAFVGVVYLKTICRIA